MMSGLLRTQVVALGVPRSGQEGSGSPHRRVNRPKIGEIHGGSQRMAVPRGSEEAQ